LKELRIRPQISDNDLKTLVKRTKKWFDKAKKKNKDSERVKAIVFFKGRQHIWMDELGPETIERFLEMLGDYKMINKPFKQGRRYVTVVDIP
jgi:translation initiation factor IF-3